MLLSHLAYPNLFYTLISKLAPSFMNHGGPMLEAACHNISSWYVIYAPSTFAKEPDADGREGQILYLELMLNWDFWGP